MFEVNLREFAIFVYMQSLLWSKLYISEYGADRNDSDETTRYCIER